MRTFVKISILFLLAATLPLAAQRTANSHSDLPMPMTAPLFLENRNYASTLYLVNVLASGVTANISLYDISGRLITTQQEYIEAHGQRATQIKHLLSSSGIYSEVGSVEVISPTHVSALLGQLSVTRLGESPEYLDEELFMPSVEASATLLTTIDQPTDSTIVALTNTSATDFQTVHVRCISSRRLNTPTTLTLQPKQTSLVKACEPSPDPVYSLDQIDEYFSAAQGAISHSLEADAAGISITTEGPPGEISAFGFAEHNSSQGTYFSAMNFTDPKQLRSTSTIFAGVPMGESSIPRATEYSAKVALTNFSDKPRQATATLYSTGNDLPLRLAQQTYSVPAHSSVLFPFPRSSHADVLWQNSFEVTADGVPGDVIPKMVFRSAGTLPNVELIGKDASDPHTAGGHPWSLEHGSNAFLLLYNHSSHVQPVMLRISNGPVPWIKDINLQPHETRNISIRDLQQQHVRDDAKAILDNQMVTGALAWWARDAEESIVTGRLVQVDDRATMARNFSCGNTVTLCEVDMTPGSTDFGIGDTGTIGTNQLFCSYSGTPPTSCSNNNEIVSATPSNSVKWSTDNSSVATMTAGVNTPTTTWQGVAGGIANLQAFVASGRTRTSGCTGFGTLTIQVPNHIVVASDNSVVLSCQYGNYEQRQVTYLVDDQYGSRIQRNISVFETVDPSTNSTCTGAPLATTSSQCTPITGGSFTDTFAAGCPKTTSLASGCGFTFPDQAWKWCNPNGSSVNLGDIGQDTVLNTSITLGGNSSSFNLGTTFPHQ